MPLSLDMRRPVVTSSHDLKDKEKYVPILLSSKITQTINLLDKFIDLVDLNGVEVQ